MDKLATSVSSMLDAFTPALQKLSEIFCVSIDYLRDNAMYYILEYGKYCLAKDLVFWCGAWMLIFSGITIIILVYEASEDAETKTLKYTAIAGIIITLLIVIIAAIFICIPYWTSPEMYSFEKVMELIQQQ